MRKLHGITKCVQPNFHTAAVITQVFTSTNKRKIDKELNRLKREANRYTLYWISEQ